MDQRPKNRMRRWGAVCLALVATLGVAGFLWLWHVDPHPEPSPPVESPPDAIVVLGGGDRSRAEQALGLGRRFTGTPVIVTGDGGTIVRELAEAGFPGERVMHEPRATSTFENARFTRPILQRLEVRRVVLVTNWFHARRALAVFAREMPGCTFTAVYAPPPDPLSPWDVQSARRERLALVAYMVRYGVWGF